jgi:ATP-grasp domain, R2K clade family 3
LHHQWVPGAWCNPENLDCAAYFAYFGKFLLNQHYAIMPGVEAIRQRDWLFAIFGKDDEVFARPTSCHKLFVGRRISRDTFASALAPTRYDPRTQVVVAAPREIAREWRLVAVGDRIIAGSQYAKGGTRAVAAACPAEVRSFAESMLAEVSWRPDPIFMLDVCEAEDRLWLVELNGFSCSWLYQCDLSAVVAEASELTRRAWNKKS